MPRRRSKSIIGAPGRYFSARQRWEQAGKPERSDEEVQRIYEQVCKPCEHYKRLTTEHGWCKLCKCSLNLGSKLNKIRWATESCPVDKWMAEVEIPETKRAGTGGCRPFFYCLQEI